MAEPTQAQIEAAAKALKDADTIKGVDSYYEILANDALTAAFAVDTRTLGEPDIDGIETKLKWARSCAELDTIERCAQVVKERADFWNKQAKEDNGDTCSESLADECEDIFAAICKLKDAP